MLVFHNDVSDSIEMRMRILVYRNATLVLIKERCVWNQLKCNIEFYNILLRGMLGGFPFEVNVNLRKPFVEK
jgi:hypothetical protein